MSHAKTNEQVHDRTALIIGATGSFGGETARALLENGWHVRAIHRDPARAQNSFAHLGPIEWVLGDAMNTAAVVAAADGVSVVVHAANPPGYRNWRGLALPMLESSIAAAKAAGARIVLPGTVYNFGPDAPALIDESVPQRPVTRKGKIRVAMEERLQEAARDGVPVLVPGKHDASHAWAYLPDLAATVVQLLERARDLQSFEVFHFAGHGFERGIELARATRDAAGAPQAPIRRFPWFAIYLLSPFLETFREMLEMRYLWSRSLLLDNRKLVSFLGREPHTSLPQALRTTLSGLGCSPAAPSATLDAALPCPTTYPPSTSR